MLTAVISFTGLVIGWLIALKTKQEVKHGSAYLLFLVRALLLVVGVMAMMAGISLLFFLVGLAAGYFVRKPYLYLGFLAGLNNMPVLYTIFLLGLPYGAFTNKRGVVYSAVTFFAAYLAYLFYTSQVVISISAGALLMLSIIIQKRL